MKRERVTTSMEDEFLKDNKNTEKLARFAASLYDKVVQVDKLATKLYSKNVLADLPEFSVWEVRGKVALDRHVLEESLNKTAVKELLEALQESGNDHIFKEISNWIQREVEKVTRNHADDPNNALEVSQMPLRCCNSPVTSGTLSSDSTEAPSSYPSDTAEAFSLPRLVQDGEDGSESHPLGAPYDGCILALARKIMPAGLLLVIVALSAGLYLVLRQTGPTILPGIFVATSKGLVAIDLLSFNATYLTSKPANAVAVNHKLKKVYWSEEKSVIMRSDFDGSAKEVIVSATGDNVYMLGIDEHSGNFYYGQLNSSKIRRCNSIGKGCAPILFRLPTFNQPLSIAIDSENRLMYLTGVGPRTGFIRASMDGSNATIIQGEFHWLFGITLQPNSSDVLFYIDTAIGIIGSINVNGHNKSTLLRLVVGLLSCNIQVDAQRIYFATINKVQRANIHSGEDLKTLFDISEPVNGLALFNANA